MKQSVTSLFGLYLDRSGLAESSVAIKKRVLKKFVANFGDMDVSNVNFGHVEDFKNIVKKGRSESSANMDLQNFKPFFSWLVKRGYIRMNPFAGLKLYNVPEKQRPIYTPEEIERILLVGGLRWNAAVLLALCSMRRSEVLNLVVRDIDFDNGRILVSPKKDTANTWRWDIKDYNQALVPMPELVAKYLIELMEPLKEQPYVILKKRHYERMLERKTEGKLTFENRNRPWLNFDRDFQHLLRRAKVEPKRYHDLRATFATNMAGVLSLTDTQKLMRHSSPTTTAKYYIRIEEQKLVARASKIINENLMVHNVP